MGIGLSKTMKDYRLITCFTLAAFAGPPSGDLLASDRIEEAFLAFGMNGPDEFQFEMNRQLNYLPNLNTDFYGEYFASEVFAESEFLKDMTVVADFNRLDFESDLTSGFEGDINSGVFSVNFRPLGAFDVGAIYSAGFVSYDSHPNAPDGQVEGNGDAHRFGVYASKQLDCGVRFGGAFMVSNTDIDAEHPETLVPGFPPGLVEGDFRYEQVSGSLSLGYSRKYGETDDWKNLSVDVSANLLYSHRDVHQDIALTYNDYDFETWWFSGRALLGYNVTDTISVYGTLAVHHLCDETDRSEVPVLNGGAIPGQDRTIGEAGGGVMALLGAGFAVHGGAEFSVYNDSYDTFLWRLGASYKF